MNAHDAAYPFLHWFWTGFFAGFGLFLMIRCRNYLSASCADCGLRIPEDNCGLLQRVEAAVERRKQAEGAPVPIGLWSGAFSFALAAVAATGRVQYALLYAFLCFGMALAIAVVFLRVRNSQPKRVAVLSARSADSVIPLYWFCAACVSSLAVLAYVANAQYRGAAVIVALSSLLTVGIAWRLTNLPALLTGVDVPAEQIVDDRLRFYRSRAAMTYAVVQTFVFCSQVIGDATILQTAGYVVTALVWIGFAIWMIRRQYSAVRIA